MKYRNTLTFSTIALAILTTGCVKKPTNETQVVYDNSQSQEVYNTPTSQAGTTYDSSRATTYEPNTATYNPSNVTTYEPNTATYDNTVITTPNSIYTAEATENTAVAPSNSIYTGEATENTNSSNAIYNTSISTSESIYTNPSTENTSNSIYTNPVTENRNTSNSVYANPATENTAISASESIYTNPVTENRPTPRVDSYDQPIASNNGAFNDPYASEDTYPDPYASVSSNSSSSSSQPSNNSYSYSNDNYSYSASSTSGSTGGIHLQIAALTDYYAAKTFKDSLSLDPKYSAYVKKGHPNKVIVRGISSVSEANRLKERRFPGAFIVSGGSSYSSSSSSSSSYAVDNGYTTNTSYGNSGATSGFGVQVGAFSTHSKAQNAADSASSRYTPLVKKVRRHGKTLYKAILTGFSSESAARKFIAKRGSGFIVRGL